MKKSAKENFPAMMIQQQHHRRRLWVRLVCVVTILILFHTAACIWILNIEQIIRGPWSSILSVIFTVLGVVLALLQWHAQSTPKDFFRGESPPVATPKLSEIYVDPDKQNIVLPGEGTRITFVVSIDSAMGTVKVHLTYSFAPDSHAC